VREQSQDKKHQKLLRNKEDRKGIILTATCFFFAPGV
jgi:hypothetical protein